MLAISTSLIFLATFSHYFQIPDSARYYQFLIPLIYAVWALAAMRVWDVVRPRQPAQRWMARATCATLFAFLSVTSLWQLHDYYEREAAAGRSNTAMLAMVQTLRADTAAPVLIDLHLGRLDTGRGGDVQQAVSYLLKLDGRPRNYVSTSDSNAVESLREILLRHTHAYLISFASTPQMLGGQFSLQPLVLTHFTCERCTVSGDFGLYDWVKPQTRLVPSRRAVH